MAYARRVAEEQKDLLCAPPPVPSGQLNDACVRHTRASGSAVYHAYRRHDSRIAIHALPALAPGTNEEPLKLPLVAGMARPLRPQRPVEEPCNVGCGPPGIPRASAGQAVHIQKAVLIVVK